MSLSKRMAEQNLEEITEWAKITETWKGQETVESRDRLCPEGTQQKKKKLFNILESLVAEMFTTLLSVFPVLTYIDMNFFGIWMWCNV